MMKLEAQPTEAGPEKKSWQAKRISIQLELMGQMGVPTIPVSDDAEREKQSLAIDEWIETYARRFAKMTDGDIGLQDQLMSDEESVKQSAMAEIIDALHEEHHE